MPLFLFFQLRPLLQLLRRLLCLRTSMPLNYRDVDLLPRLVQQYDIRAINSQRHSAICFQNKCDVEVEVDTHVKHFLPVNYF